MLRIVGDTRHRKSRHGGASSHRGEQSPHQPDVLVVAERVAIADCPGFTIDSAYAATDFLLDALSEIAVDLQLGSTTAGAREQIHLPHDRDHRTSPGNAPPLETKF
jgi:hypothetical protein